MNLDLFTRRFVMLVALLLGLAAPTFVQAQSTAQPACFAAPLGTGTYSQRVDTAAGTASYWWCPKESRYNVVRVIVAAKTGYSLKTPDTEGLSVAATLAAVWAANVSMSCDSEDLASLCAAAAKAADADPRKPLPPLWKVRANGIAQTAPLYMVTVEADSSWSWARNGRQAIADAECACDMIAGQKGSDVMCPQRANIIAGWAVCTRRN